MTVEETLRAAADVLELSEESDYDTDPSGMGGDTSYTYYRLPDRSYHSSAESALRHLAAHPALLVPAAPLDEADFPFGLKKGMTVTMTGMPGGDVPSRTVDAVYKMHDGSFRIEFEGGYAEARNPA